MGRRLSYDSWLFGAATLIVVVGLVMIYSASAIIAAQKFGGGHPYHFVWRQCVWAIAGGVAMFTLMHLNLSFLNNRLVVFGVLGVVSLALVVSLFQAPINGTHRWIVLPGFQLQASEFAKPAAVLFLAWYLSRKEDRVNELSTLLPAVAVLAGLAALILLEPDFGTATTLIAVGAGMVFAAGISWKHIAISAITVIPAALALALGAAYRRDRLFSFLNPEADPLGKGFQAMQSLIAIGTGGFGGLGIGNGRQKLFFLPEPHTDFIFSIIGEELGFVGAFLLIGLFGFLVWRGLRIVQLTQDRFVFYAALGCTLMIGFQALINVSVALCLLPTKGLPLPLVSYGGSSLIASMIAVGLLLNFSQQTS